MRTIARLKWPIVLAATGAGLTAWIATSIYLAFADPGISFLVPGETTFRITKPGDYTLWSVVEESFEGQLMTFPTGLPPGVTIKITNKSDGAVIPLRSKWPTTRRDLSGGAFQIAIGTIRFDAPGLYQIATDGLQEKRGLHLNQMDFHPLFLKASLGFLTLPLAAAGLIWGIVVLVSSGDIKANQAKPPIPVQAATDQERTL